MLLMEAQERIEGQQQELAIANQSSLFDIIQAINDADETGTSNLAHYLDLYERIMLLPR
jgi:hypothetical protein